MLDTNDLVSALKKSAIAAVETTKPTAVVFGKVLSAHPLKISLEQKLILTSAQLILTKNVTDHKVMMTVDHETEEKEGGSGEKAFEKHKHAYKGKKEFTVHNALKQGDSVALIRMQGGQKYLVIDRVVSDA